MLKEYDEKKPFKNYDSSFGNPESYVIDFTDLKSLNGDEEKFLT